MFIRSQLLRSCFTQFVLKTHQGPLSQSRGIFLSSLHRNIGEGEQTATTTQVIAGDRSTTTQVIINENKTPVVRLRGLPFEATVKDITDFFSGLKIATNGVNIQYDRNGRSNGTAMVQFDSSEMAQKALEKHKQYIGNRYIEVFHWNPSEIRRTSVGTSRPASPPTTASGSGLQRTTEQQTEEQQGQGKYVIQMRGVPYSVTHQEITNFFDPIKPVNVDLESVKRMGSAFVAFDTQEDAFKALEKDKATIGKRYIELFLKNRGT